MTTPAWDTTKKALPCPFFGSTCLARLRHHSNGKRSIKRDDCQPYGPNRAGYDEAVAASNTPPRTPPIKESRMKSPDQCTAPLFDEASIPSAEQRTEFMSGRNRPRGSPSARLEGIEAWLRSVGGFAKLAPFAELLDREAKFEGLGRLATIIWEQGAGPSFRIGCRIEETGEPVIMLR